MYQVILTKAAQKNLKKLDKRYRNALDQAIQRLAHNPQHGEPLKNELKGYWKLRFSRYRILYQIIELRLIVEVLDIIHRKDAYRSK